MSNFSETRVGFDLVDSPFGALHASDSYYAFGHKDFKLADFADGYIYQGPFQNYTAVAVDKQFITKENLAEAIANLPNPALRKTLTSPDKFFRSWNNRPTLRMKSSTSTKRISRSLNIVPPLTSA